MSRVEILQKMQLVIQEQMGKEDIVLTEATKLDDLGVDSIELMEFIINLRMSSILRFPMILLTIWLR